MKNIRSYNELEESLKKQARLFMLLYKSSTVSGNCAISEIKKLEELHQSDSILAADVVSVKDIHEKFNIKTVPSLLEFKNGLLHNTYKGCMQTDQLKAILSDHSPRHNTSSASLSPRVTVYSTPSCSWCTTLKNYLRDHRINFRDIDVSSDEEMARQMVRKSGQQGVPQTDINGQIIVGFDRQRINQLLNIQN